MTSRPSAERVVDPEHGLVARHTATDADDRARLLRSARHLQALGLPGLVEVLSEHEERGSTEVLTRWLGTATLADALPLPATELAGVLAAVATTVADLHDRGFVHGQLRADHILLGGGPRPVLCGTTALRLAGAASQNADVAELANVVLETATTVPVRSGLTARRRLVRLGRTVREAPSACDARRLAAELAAIPGACLPRLPPLDVERDPPAPTAGSLPVRPPDAGPAGAPPHPKTAIRSAATFGIAALGVVLVVAGLARLRAAHPTLIHRSVAARGDVAGPPKAAMPSPSPPPSTAIGKPCPGSGHPTAAGTTRIDIDGDGCPEAVQVGAGRLVVDGVRYRLGRPGDLAALGDWYGIGVATPALLRPSTGAVFLFRAWPGPGRPLVAKPSMTVPGARALTVQHRPAGVDRLVVLRRGRPPLTVTP